MWVVEFNLSTGSSILVNEYQVKHEKMHFFYLILLVQKNEEATILHIYCVTMGTSNGSDIFLFDFWTSIRWFPFVLDRYLFWAKPSYATTHHWPPPSIITTQKIHHRPPPPNTTQNISTIFLQHPSTPKTTQYMVIQIYL